MISVVCIEECEHKVDMGLLSSCRREGSECHEYHGSSGWQGSTCWSGQPVRCHVRSALLDARA